MENKNKENNPKAALACKHCGMRHDNLEKLQAHIAIHEAEIVIGDASENATFSGEKTSVRDEIMSEALSPKSKGKIRMGDIAMTLVLVILISVSLLQAWESYNVMAKIQSGSYSSASSPAIPSNLQNLPNMVGGC